MNQVSEQFKGMVDYMRLQLSNGTGYHVWFVVPGSEFHFIHEYWWHGSPQYLEIGQGPIALDLEITEVVDKDNVGITKCIPGQDVHNLKIHGKQISKSF